MNVKGSDSCAMVTPSINSTEALEGQEVLMLSTGCPGCSSKGLRWGSPGCLQADGAEQWWLCLPTQGLLPWASRPYSDFQPCSNPIDGVARDADGIRAQQNDEALGICLRADPRSAAKGNGCF